MQYRHGRMEKNILNLLLSELSTSGRYLESIFSAIREVTGLNSSQEINHDFQRLYMDFCHFLEDNLFLPQYDCDKDNCYTITEICEEFTNIHQLVLSFLKLRPDQDYAINFAVAYNNLIYDYAHLMHTHCHNYGDIEILFPRTSLATIEEKIDSLPKFVLHEETIYQFQDEENALIESLEFKRKKKYEHLISEGHKEIFKEAFGPGLEHFLKASHFIETAEILTLIGWVYSLKNDNEKAKSFCLKAIKLDPNYGPPYNDIGSYLLAEGKIVDSIKWFNLAKKAIVYQNREYPYINTGRAYLLQKENTLALDEFSKALTLAPYHTELHETVSKLRSNLEKSQKEPQTEVSVFSQIGQFLEKNDEHKPLHDWT